MYAVVSDMFARFQADELIQLTDVAGTGAVDEARITTALVTASNLIDLYVGKKYDLPLPSVPPILVEFVCDIARYKLHRDAAPDYVKTAYDEAVRSLKDLANGIGRLDIAGEEPAPEPATIDLQDSVVATIRDKYRGF